MTKRKDSKKRGWIRHQTGGINAEELKKKYLSQVVQHAQEELQTEYKQCVQDIVDFASNSSKLFYREMALRYWLLLVTLSMCKEIVSLQGTREGGNHLRGPDCGKSGNHRTHHHRRRKETLCIHANSNQRRGKRATITFLMFSPTNKSYKQY